MAGIVQYFRIESAVAGNRDINIGQGGINDYVFSLMYDVEKAMNRTSLIQTRKVDVDASETARIEVETDVTAALRSYLLKIQHELVTIACFSKDTIVEQKYTNCQLKHIPGLAKMSGKTTLVFLKING